PCSPTSATAAGMPRRGWPRPRAVRPDPRRATASPARPAARRILILLAVASLVPAAVLFPSRAHAADLTPQQQVEGRLMCYCGCSDLTVRVCTCGTADSIRQEIASRLGNGETPDQVVAAFVAQH